jgi:aldehyde dehydrogenase (NAD+)
MATTEDRTATTGENGHAAPPAPAAADRAPIRWDYAPAPESTDHVRLRDRYGLFIGGAFVEADAYAPTINPATEEPLAEIAQASEADVARAV